MPINPKDSTFENSISSVGFYQSNSLHSFNSKSNYSSTIASSKSSNCICDGLIENEELIEKLFPKCRPKPKTKTITKSERAERNVKRVLPDNLPNKSKESVEMNNTLNNTENDVNQEKANITTSKSKVKSSYPSNFTGFQPRRIWNFMDISPSPSPPPLSPIEDLDLYNSANYLPNSMLADDDSSQFYRNQDRSANMAPEYSTTFDCDSRNVAKMKKTDIHTLEVNKCLVSNQNVTEELSTSRTNKSEGTAKNCLDNKEAGAHFRLDNLLLSPDERDGGFKSKNSLHSRKMIRIPVDYDLNDDDDVLFSRINSNNSVKAANSAQADTLNVNCNMKESIQSLKSDKSKNSSAGVGEVPLSSFTKSATNVEQEVSKSTKMLEEEEDYRQRINVNEAGCDIEQAEEVNKEGSVSRNRIEKAGGKEIFSSSRGAKSKRRSNSVSSGQLVRNQDRRSSNSRQTQLYSVSMAAEGTKYESTGNTNNKEKECKNSEHAFVLGDVSQSSEECFQSTEIDGNVRVNLESNRKHYKLTKCKPHITTDSQKASLEIDSVQNSEDISQTVKATNICEFKREYSLEYNDSCNASEIDIHTKLNYVNNDSLHNISLKSSQDIDFETQNKLEKLIHGMHSTESVDCHDDLSCSQSEPNFGDKNDEKVSFLCDQFTKDLKERLDVVSSEPHQFNSIDEDTKFEQEDEEAYSDTDSVISPSKKSLDPNEKIARVIGSVPIAQYEGSPKRYGPKPGYPKRITSSCTSISTTMEYATNASKMSQHSKDDKTKSTVLSSENGSPNSSTSSSSSATFSSTDIHSSSSFSYPFNRKSNGSNWNAQKRISSKVPDGVTTTEESISNKGKNNCEVSCDELVKSILSIPTGNVDSEDEENLPSSSDKHLKEKENLNDKSSINANSSGSYEPIYSTINFNNDQFKTNAAESSASSQRIVAEQTNCKMRTTAIISTNGCESSRSVTSLKSQPYCNNNNETTQESTSQNETNVNAIQNNNRRDSSESRNFPKSLNLNNYPHFLQPSQSFESTDSSYRSDKFNAKEYFYPNSDEDSYFYEQNAYPGKESSKNRPHTNGNTDFKSFSDSSKTYQQPILNYNSLSPELTNSKNTLPKTLNESPGCSSDQGEVYSEILSNDKPLSVTGENDNLINAMPILEDGLSSGMPSSDEIDYEDEEDCDEDIGTQEQDLDEYVNEYNNSRTVVGCESTSANPNRYIDNATEMVNGSDPNFAYHFKQGDYPRGHSAGEGQPFSFRCLSKNGPQYRLDMPEKAASNKNGSSYEHSGYYHSHHMHHMNHHVHNHPIIDNSRQSSSPPFDSNKSHLPGNIGSHDKYCLSSQMRSTNSNNAVGPIRNSSSQLVSSGKQTQSLQPSSPPLISNSQHSHHHYHHYYHPHSSQQYNSAQQNYPNLSSSPTSLSPNSPGQHNPSSNSSTSSSSHQQSSVPHHYHQQTQAKQPSSQTQEMPLPESPSDSIVGPVTNVRHHHDEDCDTDQETDRLLGSQRNDDRYYDDKTPTKRSNASREAQPEVLIEGVLFRARYLGSTQLVCDGQPTKATRMMQAEEAVSRIKAPEGESQPSTEVDLFISTEKIMVLNTDLKEIMMDHALRTISYIADIGDLLVLMARRRSPIDDPNDSGIKRIPKMICHVFESEEAQYIAQSIGQAFQVAYMEFLKANGIKDSSFLKEMDYQEVLNSQEIFGDELEMFAKREKQKEVIVPKQKGEILGIVIVESGWGSMLPTVVIANLAQNSPSARCGQLNIGDQIIAINGISLVGLPLSTCQAYVKNTKNQTAVKFTIVPCAPVVEVKIKRPDTKYQLGFSVQNGVICSLLRGGIAERGGVRVGHRIIEINGQSVVAVPHDRIVNLLATSVGEIHMKTMPTSMFRLLTGQESPSYM